jgi:hypothetical protein
MCHRRLDYDRNPVSLQILEHLGDQLRNGIARRALVDDLVGCLSVHEDRPV